MTSENELSRPTSSTWLTNLEATATIASVVPQANSENAVMQPLEVKRLLSETLPLDPTDTEPQPFIFENESSPISLSGQPDHAEPEAKNRCNRGRCEAATGKVVAGRATSFSLLPREEAVTRNSLASWTMVGPAVETVAATPPTHAVTAQQQTKSLPLTDLTCPGFNQYEIFFP